MPVLHFPPGVLDGKGGHRQIMGRLGHLLGSERLGHVPQNIVGLRGHLLDEFHGLVCCNGNTPLATVTL